MKNQFLYFVICLFFASCNPDTMDLDVVGLVCGQSPRADERFADSQAYNEKHGFAVVHAWGESYNVYVCTDSHVDFTRDNLDAFVNVYRHDLFCPVAIHLGDHVNAQNHWDYMYKAYERHGVKVKMDTLFAVAGNHDLYFNQWSEYTRLFGTSTYYFIVETTLHKRDFFLMLDSSEGTLGVSQMKWIKQILDWADKQDFRHRVVCTHTNMFQCDLSQGHTSNYTLEDTYELIDLFASHNVEMYWAGHDHYREITKMRGITFITIEGILDSQESAGYMVARMGEDISCDFVRFNENEYR